MITPQGKLILRTLAMPRDTNANGDIFGGWIMSQMDMGGAILAKEIAKSPIVTVAANHITFKRPICVGDVVCVYGRCLKIGNTSLEIAVDVYKKEVYKGDRVRFLAASGSFIYVAIDQNGKSHPIDRNDNPDLEEAMALMSNSTEK